MWNASMKQELTGATLVFLWRTCWSSNSDPVTKIGTQWWKALPKVSDNFSCCFLVFSKIFSHSILSFFTRHVLFGLICFNVLALPHWDWQWGGGGQGQNKGFVILKSGVWVKFLSKVMMKCDSWVSVQLWLGLKWWWQVVSECVAVAWPEVMMTSSEWVCSCGLVWSDDDK